MSPTSNPAMQSVTSSVGGRCDVGPCASCTFPNVQAPVHRRHLVGSRLTNADAPNNVEDDARRTEVTTITLFGL